MKISSYDINKDVVADMEVKHRADLKAIYDGYIKEAANHLAQMNISLRKASDLKAREML